MTTNTKPNPSPLANVNHEVDYVIHVGWAIPMESPEPTCLDQQAIIIDQGKILGLCPSQEVPETLKATHVLHKPNHVALPGLINNHGHSPMTLFRGFADDLPLMTWLEEHIWPAEGQWVNETFVATGSKLAIAEMILSGTTSFTDMYFFPEVTAKEALHAGIRAQLAAPTIEFQTPWAKTADEHIHKTLALHDDFKHQDLIQVGFGPHAPYTVTDKSFEKIATLAEELDTFIQVHLHETQQEIADSIKNTGLRPIERLKQLGLISPNLQAVHMTQLNESEIELFAQQNATIVHCPESNLKLASGFCPLGALTQAGVNCTLGTDGAASNNDLDLLSETRLAAQLAKAVHHDSTAVSAYEALKMVTINAAKSLNRDQELGSLAVGKLADVVLMDLNQVNTQPIYHPISQVVYAAQSNQITDVWIAGKPVLKDRQLSTLDLHQTLAEAKEWGTKIGNT